MDKFVLWIKRPESMSQFESLVLKSGLRMKGTPIDSALKKPLSSLADRWRQVQGEDRWNGMLDPLDLDLRKELIRYGDLVQVMYDAFDYGPHSKYAGTSRYGKSTLFQEVGLDDPVHGRNTDYEITRFIYGTSESTNSSALILRSFCLDAWSRETNWSGYVAVANDAGKKWLGRRDILICFRGTLRNLEWVDNFCIKLVKIPPLDPFIFTPSINSDSCEQDARLNTVRKSDSFETRLRVDDDASSCWTWPWPWTWCQKTPIYEEQEEEDPEDILIHEGWKLIYTSKNPNEPLGRLSAREQIIQELQRLIKMYKDDDLSITIVGHSLGAALAVLCAYDIADLGVNTRRNSKGDIEVIPVTAFSYGTPGVGNLSFRKHAEQLPGLRFLRICNSNDFVEAFPGSFFGYEHAGEKLQFDSTLSPYLRISKNPGDQHNLQANLHMVAGMQGSKSGKKFELVIKRDIALVNKTANILKDELLIPANWWQQENKGLVLDFNGDWRLPDRRPHELPNIDNPDFN